ncbi:MAG: lipoate--protein ligase family protein [Candidatus Bathyarchaeia archaeon]|nr:lipoate--protein ligase family protein [Candidatus Bathyarchaeota archaeon]
MVTWRLLDSEITYDAAKNLAIDEAILQARIQGIIPPTLRFWRNNRAVIVGHSQKVCAEVNLDECFKEGIQVVKRFSGGGTVYHDLGNLNYTIVLDSNDPLVKGLDIAGSYKTLCSGIIKGLELLGLSSISLIPPGSIFVQGKKISGSAQLRRRNVILHHGTLLINSDLNMLKKVLYNKEKRRESTSIWSPVTNIRDELNREITMTEIKNVLIRGFKESLGIELESRNIESVENDIASKIYYTKYLILE